MFPVQSSRFLRGRSNEARRGRRTKGHAGLHLSTQQQHFGEVLVTHAAALPELMTTVDQGFTDFLVAYDFSAAAETALKYAAELSSHLGSTIHLISVETPAEYSRIMCSEPRVREHVHDDVRRAFDNIEKRLRAKGIPCDSAHRVGDVSDVLEGATLEGKTDLLLLGAFGHGQTDRPQLGSTAEHILRAAHCPVLTIGPHAVQHAEMSPKIDRLLCVTNSTVDDHELLAFAGRFAAAVHGRLELLHVVDLEQRALSCEDHERLCETQSRTLRDHGVDVSWTLLYGPPDQVIPARAAELKASLILLGIGRPGSQEAVANHETIDTIRKAHCPVLTVPSGGLHWRSAEPLAPHFSLKHCDGNHGPR
jgi:nucleotide-binding universal stress UspA family protein